MYVDYYIAKTMCVQLYVLYIQYYNQQLYSNRKYNIHMQLCTCYLVVYLLNDAVNFILEPSEPRSLVVISISSSSVTLQWRLPETPNGIITQYSILYNGTNIINFGNNTLRGTIEGLSSDTLYDVQVRAHTGVGAGSPTNITFLTSELLSIRIFKFNKVCSIYVPEFITISSVLLYLVNSKQKILSKEIFALIDQGKLVIM